MKFDVIYADNLENVAMHKNTIVVDIRTREEYERSHWKDAISMPIDITDSYENVLAKDIYIIFYCTHGGSSMKLARYMGNRGYNTATVIGGYNAIRGYEKKLEKTI